MTGRNRRNFSPEFRLEAAQLVLDQHYTVAAAATAMNVGKSTMDKWVRQLKEERAGKSPIASPMTPEQNEMRGEYEFSYGFLNILCFFTAAS
ncbi:transposase IS3/IS911 family protein [Enterobacter ludwigii]|jgi:transposase|nr:transposase IS3/IS911 family protein [Enterobacter ludwigii]